jgi:hypothetical protein
MASHISHQKAPFISIMNQTQSVLENTIRPQSTIMKTTSQISKNTLLPGEQNKNQESESQQNLHQERQEILKPVSHRCLTMTNEEFYQWRQVLGSFHTKISSYIDSDLNAQ